MRSFVITCLTIVAGAIGMAYGIAAGAPGPSTTGACLFVFGWCFVAVAETEKFWKDRVTCVLSISNGNATFYSFEIRSVDPLVPMRERMLVTKTPLSVHQSSYYHGLYHPQFFWSDDGSMLGCDEDHGLYKDAMDAYKTRQEGLERKADSVALLTAESDSE